MFIFRPSAALCPPRSVAGMSTHSPDPFLAQTGYSEEAVGDDFDDEFDFEADDEDEVDIEEDRARER